MLAIWTMIVILAYGILSGVIIVSTVVLLGQLDLLPNQEDLVGTTLLVWGTILLVYSFGLHTLTMFLIQPLINIGRRKINKIP